MTLSTIEYACSLLDPHFRGHILEFGVYKGDSLKKIVANTIGYPIFGFDSFQGLPEDWKDPQGEIVGRGKKGRFTTGGVIPNIPEVIFYKGWFENTIPEYIKKEQPSSISLLHIDCDLYSSTKTVLELLNGFIVKDTLIVFDEWVYNRKVRDHEQRAFCEWTEKYNRDYKLIYFLDTTPSGCERQIVRILK